MKEKISTKDFNLISETIKKYSEEIEKLQPVIKSLLLEYSEDGYKETFTNWISKTYKIVKSMFKSSKVKEGLFYNIENDYIVRFETAQSLIRYKLRLRGILKNRINLITSFYEVSPKRSILINSYMMIIDQDQEFDLSIKKLLDSKRVKYNSSFEHFRNLSNER